MPHHVCHFTSVLMSILGPCAHAAGIIKIQDTAHQNISLQKHHRVGNDILSNFCVWALALNYYWVNECYKKKQKTKFYIRGFLHHRVRWAWVYWLNCALWLNSNWLVWIGWEQARAGYLIDNKGPACPLSTPIISRHIHFWTQMPHLHASDPASQWHHADSSRTCTAYRSAIHTEQQLPSWFMHFFTLRGPKQYSDRRTKLCAV